MKIMVWLVVMYLLVSDTHAVFRFAFLSHFVTLCDRAYYYNKRGVNPEDLIEADELAEINMLTLVARNVI
jgi:hypothetical protein